MRTISGVPLRAIIAGFSDEGAADSALELLQKAGETGAIRIREAVVLRRDEDNKLHVKDAAHRGPLRAAAVDPASAPALPASVQQETHPGRRTRIAGTLASP